MVMLLKPVVPLSPVTVKDTVVDVADWFVAIVTLDICELVMFPLIVRSTVAPLAVVAGTVVTDGVGEGDGTGVEEVPPEEAPPEEVEVGWFTVTVTALEVAETGTEALSVTLQITKYKPADSLKM